MKGDKVNKLIEESGNNFHYSVVNFLRQNGWVVLVSPYYNDYLSDRAKEIDIVAEKLFITKDVFGKNTGCIKVHFFIECKYINGDIVFWFDEKDKKKSFELVVRSTPLKENNAFTDKHHYITESRAAKLFSSNLNKEDVIYKALTQSIHSMIYFRGNGFPIEQDHFWKKSCVINYPIILCNSFNHFYRVESSLTDGYVAIDTASFQLEVNYAYLDQEKNNRSEYFIVDAVDFSKFKDFITGLETADIDAIKQVTGFEWQKQEVN